MSTENKTGTFAVKVGAGTVNYREDLRH